MALDELDRAAAATSSRAVLRRREEDLARAFSGACPGLVERGRGTRASSESGATPSWPRWTRRPTSDVVSTLEAEAARLASEIALVAEETSADPGAAELEAKAGAVEAEEAALRQRWSSVLGEGDPDDAMAQVQARTEPLGRAEARERHDLTALERQVASIEQRHAAAAVKADLLGPSPLAGGDNEHVWRRRPPRAGAPWRRRPRGPRAPSGWPTSASSPATAARPGRGPRAGPAGSPGSRWAWLLRGVDGVVGSLLSLVEIDDGWEAAFEAAAGAGVAAVVVDGRQSARRPWRRCTSAGSPAPCWRPGPGRTSPPRSRVRGPRACGATCTPVTVRRLPSRCSMR